MKGTAMNRRHARLLALSTLVAILVTTVHAGGWSIITLREFPDQALTGQPLTLTFAVRQHGSTLIDGLSPTVRASMAGGAEIQVAALPTLRHGEYTATVRFPASGEWTLRVDGGFNPGDKTRENNSMVLPPLSVVRQSSVSRIAYTQADRGDRLFVTKGCVGCHKAGSERDLTKKYFNVDYLKTVLADPGIRTTDMPNLELKEHEISALVAFINRAPSTRPVAARSE